MRYNYWLLRYVPSSVRGEFVNIGVIVGSDDTADWAIRRVQSLSRASRLGGEPALVEDSLQRLQRVVEPGHWKRVGLEHPPDPPSSMWLDRIRRHLNNTFQVSAAVPVSASNASEAADRLFASLVFDPGLRGRNGERALAVRELREAFFMATDLTKREIQQRVRVHAGRQQTRMEFAIGQVEIAQLSQVWSFKRQALDGLAQEVQASSYAVQRLRKDGGELINPARKRQPALPLESDIPIRVLYVPPESRQQQLVFADAEDAWADLGIKAYKLGDERMIAKEADELVRVSH